MYAIRSYYALISVIMGIFTYFFILGGLLVVSAGSPGESANLMLYGSIAFLAGFSFSRFTDKLEEIATALFSKKN